MTHWKVKGSSIILAICLVGFLKPPFVSTLPVLDSIFNLIRILGVGIILLYSFTKRIRPGSFTYGIAFYELFYIAITFFHDGDIGQAVINGVTIIGEMLLFEMAIKRGRSIFIEFLDLICHILSIYVVLNIITMFVLPEGFAVTDMGTPVYFLGIPNRFVFWMLPFISLSCCSSYLKKDKLSCKQYIIHIICFVTLFWHNSWGGFLGLLMLYIFWFFGQKKNAKWADYRLYLMIYIVLWIALTFGGLILLLLSNISFLSEKSASLIARLSLWSKGIKYLKTDIDYMLFGFGLENSDVIKQKFWYVHLHNNLLNVAYQTGIIGTLAYIIPFIRLTETFKIYKYNLVGKILSFTLFIFFIILLVDTYDLYGHLYIFGVMASNMQIIFSNSNLESSKKTNGEENG